MEIKFLNCITFGPGLCVLKCLQKLWHLLYFNCLIKVDQSYLIVKVILVYFYMFCFIELH